jgi:hypothetical protein
MFPKCGVNGKFCSKDWLAEDGTCDDNGECEGLEKKMKKKENVIKFDENVIKFDENAIKFGDKVWGWDDNYKKGEEGFFIGNIEELPYPNLITPAPIKFLLDKEICSGAFSFVGYQNIEHFKELPNEDNS